MNMLIINIIDRYYYGYKDYNEVLWFACIMFQSVDCTMFQKVNCMDTANSKDQNLAFNLWLTAPF